jgi:hypothetical protein
LQEEVESLKLKVAQPSEPTTPTARDQDEPGPLPARLRDGIARLLTPYL